MRRDLAVPGHGALFLPRDGWRQRAWRQPGDQVAGERVVQADEPDWRKHLRLTALGPSGALQDRRKQQEARHQRDDEYRLEACRHAAEAHPEDRAQHFPNEDHRSEREETGRDRHGELDHDQRQRREQADLQLRHHQCRVEHAREAADRQREDAGEDADGAQLGAHDDTAVDRQRSEDRGVARIERQRVPCEHRHQRHDDHRERHEHQPIAVRQQRRSPRGLEGHEQELHRAQDGDEESERDQRAAHHGNGVVAIRVWRQEIVLEEALQEVLGEQALKHVQPPRRRCRARSVQGWSRGRARRTPPRATGATSACAGAGPCPGRRCGRGAGR